MTIIAVVACLLIAALLWLAMRKPVLLVDRHADEIGQYKTEIENIAAAQHSGMIEAHEAHAQTIDLQRRMLRSKRDTGHITQASKNPVVLVLLIGVLAGCSLLYLQQGQPSLVDHPIIAAAKSPQAQQSYVQSRDRLLKQPDDINAWLTMSDALIQMGETERATEGLQKATEVMPKRIDLWVARGQALVAHAGGIVTPAARLAFDRASQLNPKHPGPRLYLALAWMQAAQPEEALKVLEPLAKDSPPNAPWMPKVNRMITGCKTMLAAGVGKP